MGTAGSIKRVKDIISNTDEQIHVVVSALGGTTDILINAAKNASKGEEYSDLITKLFDRHVDVANEIRPGVMENIKEDFNDKFSALLSLLKGISLTRELSTRSLDIVTGFGEQLSACFLHSIVDGSILFDSRDYIRTVKTGDKNRADLEETEKLLKEVMKKAGRINIWPGFISRDVNGDDTTLGRGGSDYTAAIIAAVLDASILEIWTDVDGFMSGDPRVIKRAYSISHLTYAEALELSHFGAKVIYPPQ